MEKKSKAAKLKVSGGMTCRAYPVLTRAIEEGVRYGWRRAHKHVDRPDEDALCNAIEDGVANAICEVFRFDEDDVGPF